MITANLSHAMHDFVTSIIVGKDIVSRTGTVTFERLIDQVEPPCMLSCLSKNKLHIRNAWWSTATQITLGPSGH